MHIKLNKSYIVALLAVTAFALRLWATQLDATYDNDLLTFQVWANDLFSNGLSRFYGGSGFTDYPPFYMYVLYGIGLIRTVFDWPVLSPAYNLLIRIPAISCDIAIGLFIYLITKPRDTSMVTGSRDDGASIGAVAIAMACAFWFNPAVILDSAIWGQVDSIYTLLLLVSMHYLNKEQYTPSYLLYGAAILTKPQSIIIGPIYLYTAYDFLYKNRFSRIAVKQFAVALFSAAVLMILLVLPFTQNLNFMPVIRQYVDTLDSYAFGSVNAYNFFALIGANWMPLSTLFLGIPYSIWGAISIILIVLAGLAVLHVGQRDFFLVAAALNVLTFMFSVKMHERYLFPSLAFLLASFAYHRKDVRVLGLYTAFSATFLINCADILRMLKNGNQLSVIKKSLPVISFINLGLTLYMIYVVVDTCTRNLSRSAPSDGSIRIVRWPISFGGTNQQRSSYTLPPKMGRMDYIALITLSVLYAIIAFTNLGDTQIPQTTWTPKAGDVAIIDFGSVKNIKRFQFMMGARHDRPFMFYASKDGQNWDYQLEIEEANVFAWTDYYMDIQARYVEIIPFGEGLMIQEAAFRDQYDRLIPITSVSSGMDALTDEQTLVPVSASYKNGTYFDEIYHARTGYEYVHRLTVYENTHPPLGKDLIALSIKILGMTPFAWRFPGTLFGVLMIPLIYALARHLFCSNGWAFFAAFIFTFDFMHFAQTRIATIDTFVTFFVVAMYLFMYLYVKRFAYDPLPHTLCWLGLSGLCMGLAIAAKWQGIYGAVGLPVLFIPLWFKQYQSSPRIAWVTAAWCVMFFILVPLMVYALSYIPFVIASGGGGITTIIDNQRHMFWYHSTLESEHSFSSQWWQWPLMTRPMYFYASTVSNTLRQGISSFGNPAVWWCGLVATPLAAYALCKKYDYNILFLLIAYAAQYLPWVLVPRTTYIYHYFPSVPFVVLLITWFFKERVAAKNIKWAYGYATITVALFALFYPVLSGMTFSVRFVHTFLRWLPGWVLM